MSKARVREEQCVGIKNKFLLLSVHFISFFDKFLLFYENNIIHLQGECFHNS